MNRRVGTWGVLVLALTGACGDDAEIMRKVVLQSDLSLPGGEVRVADGMINIDTHGLEPLADGARYVVFLTPHDDEDAPQALGEISESGSLMAMPASIPEDGTLTVTEESEGDALPATPSSLVRLSGDLSGELAFQWLEDSHAAEGMTGEATLTNDHAEVEISGLPAPPEGASYGLWAVWGELTSAAETEEAHEHLEIAAPNKDEDHEEEEEEGAVEEQRTVFIGTLDSAGHLSGSAGSDIVDADGLWVTLESAQGGPLPSPATVLMGEITLPEVEAAEAGHSH